MQDNTDRNRTSPFAFTGNKFEFRMPGSAENLSDANTILNTAVAKELKGYADELEGAEDFTSAAIALIKRTIRDHRRVIFNGNGYTAEWEEEAARRGLPNKKNTPAALPALIDPKNIQLMEDFGVLTKIEMESRYEVEMEHYSKIINIEALTMLEMARKQLLPAINAYMSEVANTAASKLAVSEAISVRSETKTLTRLSTDADAMLAASDAYFEHLAKQDLILQAVAETKSLAPTQEELDDTYGKFLELADKKKEIHDYDLLYLVGDIDRMKQQSVSLKFLQVTTGTLVPTATVVLKFGDHERMAIATGNGPVDAAVSAIKTLINEKVVLMEFLMQAITKGSNDVGRVHVQVQCGSRTVHGFAAHTDTTRASIEAFLDALRVLNVTERKEKEE